MSTKAMIEDFLSRPAMALFGMSRSGKKFGNYAYRALVAKRYRVYPVHPTASSIDGIRCYSRLSELPERVNAVLVVVPPPQAVDVIRDAAAVGIRHVWLQQGAESPEAVRVGAELGLDVVAGECILMFAQPTGIHKAHRWLRQITHRLPAGTKNLELTT